MADYYRTAEWELFDNRNDPHQLNNVIDHPEYVSVAEDLRSRLSEISEKFDKTEDKNTAGFTVTGGTLKQTGPNLELTGKPLSGYAIRPVPAGLKAARKITLQATMHTASKGNSNGLLCFGDSSDPKDMIKCGVYTGTGELVVLYGEFGRSEKNIIRQKSDLKRGQIVDLSVVIDLDTQSLRMTANENTLTAPLHKTLNSGHFHGINSNRTRIRVEKLNIQHHKE